MPCVKQARTRHVSLHWSEIAGSKRRINRAGLEPAVLVLTSATFFFAVGAELLPVVFVDFAL
jgi:hypothetical protein